MQGTSWVSIALSVCWACWLSPIVAQGKGDGRVVLVGFSVVLQGVFLVFLVGVPAFLCKRDKDEFMPAWAVLPFSLALFILFVGFVALAFFPTSFC